MFMFMVMHANRDPCKVSPFDRTRLWPQIMHPAVPQVSDPHSNTLCSAIVPVWALRTLKEQLLFVPATDGV